MMKNETRKQDAESAAASIKNASKRVVYFAYQPRPEQLVTPEPYYEAVYGSAAPLDTIRNEIRPFKSAAEVDETPNTDNQNR